MDKFYKWKLCLQPGPSLFDFLINVFLKFSYRLGPHIDINNWTEPGCVPVTDTSLTLTMTEN